MIRRMPLEDRPISAPEGTYPLDEWPVDVMRTDASGELDLEQLEYNRSLTPEERMEQYFQWMRFIEALRKARRGKNGVGPEPAEPAE